MAGIRPPWSASLQAALAHENWRGVPGERLLDGGLSGIERDHAHGRVRRARLRLDAELMRFPERAVQRARLQQLLVAAEPDHLAAIQHEQAVDVGQGREAV